MPETVRLRFLMETYEEEGGMRSELHPSPSRDSCCATGGADLAAWQRTLGCGLQWSVLESHFALLQD
jgi:hypothetical protein